MLSQYVAFNNHILTYCTTFSAKESSMENTKSTTIDVPFIDDLGTATGPVTIRMTNDYLFRALLQRNNRVLKSLISSLLHLTLDEIISVEIANGIELGRPVHLLSMPYLLKLKPRR